MNTPITVRSSLLSATFFEIFVFYIIEYQMKLLEETRKSELKLC